MGDGRRTGRRGRPGGESRASRPLVTGLLVLAVAGAGAACSDPLDTRRDALAENRARWASAGLEDYRYVYSRICFCPPLDARVEVRAGAVVSAVDPETGDPLPAEDVERVPTVEELFAEVDAAFREEPAVASVTYDPELGHPTDAFFDFSLRVADEERGFTAKELEPLDGDDDGS